MKPRLLDLFCGAGGAAMGVISALLREVAAVIDRDFRPDEEDE